MEALMEFPGVIMKNGQWRGPFSLHFGPGIGVPPHCQDGYDAADRRCNKWNIREPISATEVARCLRLAIGEELIAKTVDDYFATPPKSRVNALWVELVIKQQFPQGKPDEVRDAAGEIFPECYAEYWTEVF